MRYSSTAAAALVAALSMSDALAGPTPHHRHMHKRVDYSKLDWNNMGIDWAAAYSKGQAAKQTPAPSSAQAPAPAAYTQAPAAPSAAASKATTSANNAANDVKDTTDKVVQGVAQLFGGLVGYSNNLKAFGGRTAVTGADGDSQMGNYGSPYGSNIIKIANGDVDKFDFTNTFYNDSPEDMTIVIWNKVGHDLQPQSGPSEAPKKPTLSFALKPGQSQSVAFDEDTNGAWAQACDAKAASGAFATTWGEFTFRKADSSKGKGGSAFNLSAILNKNGNTYNMTISAPITAPTDGSKPKTCVSDMNNNSWDREFHPQGESDGNCYVPLDKVRLTTHMYGNI